jgi:uncharacterized protein (TIGR02996 family)
VTTEDDFQAALDARPEDWQTRLVFADWLGERGDPRAEGYRALGTLRFCPFVDPKLSWWTTYPAACCPRSGVRGNGCSLPVDWFDLVDLSPNSNRFKPLNQKGRTATRREVENAAAVAFGNLPEDRRAGLLAEQLVPPKARKRSVRKRSVRKKAAPMKAAPKSVALKKATPKKAAPKKAAPKTAAPKGTAPKKTAPKSTTPKSAAPKKAAPKKAGRKK